VGEFGYLCTPLFDEGNPLLHPVTGVLPGRGFAFGRVGKCGFASSFRRRSSDPDAAAVTCAAVLFPAAVLLTLSDVRPG